jgi:hypothetical protein
MDILKEDRFAVNRSDNKLIYENNHELQYNYNTNTLSMIFIKNDIIQDTDTCRTLSDMHNLKTICAFIGKKFEN